MSDQLRLRDAVTKETETVIGQLRTCIEGLPNRYGDGNTIKRDDALNLLEIARVALLQKLDAAVVNHGWRTEAHE